MDYRVLKGKVTDGKFDGHYQLLVEAAGAPWRIAFNVRSEEKPYAVRYCIDNNFRDPLTTAMSALAEGLTPARDVTGPAVHQYMSANGLAIDFVRGTVLSQNDLQVLEKGKTDAKSYVEQQLGLHVELAKQDASSFICAFGVPWGPETQPDQYFTFKPGQGIHDIHMNQGNSGSYKGHNFSDDDGVGQDGALFFSLPASGIWVGFFIAFQSQSFDTDDQGHRRGSASGLKPVSS
jgi:uncharacterized protein YukJ